MAFVRTSFHAQSADCSGCVQHSAKPASAHPPGQTRLQRSRTTSSGMPRTAPSDPGRSLGLECGLGDSVHSRGNWESFSGSTGLEGCCNIVRCGEGQTARRIFGRSQLTSQAFVGHTLQVACTVPRRDMAGGDCRVCSATALSSREHSRALGDRYRFRCPRYG